MKNKIVYDLLSKDFKDQFHNSISQYITNIGSLDSKIKIEPNTQRLFSYLFTGTRGGANRLRIILLLAKKPLNLHQIAKELDLDYKAIQFHIEILVKNNLVSCVGERYGALYFLSTFLEHNIGAFNEVVIKLYKSLNFSSLEIKNL